MEKKLKYAIIGATSLGLAWGLGEMYGAISEFATNPDYITHSMKAGEYILKSFTGLAGLIYVHNLFSSKQ